MFSISGCEAADVSSPMEMAVEVVNGNISYNSPLEETIRIHLHYITLHYHLNINNSQASQLTISIPREFMQLQVRQVVDKEAAVSSSARWEQTTRTDPALAFSLVSGAFEVRLRTGCVCWSFSFSNISHFQCDNLNVNGLNRKEISERKK